MQGSQESHYEGMIIADPNMVLNVTVPKTVQKQAENWERGTRTLLQKPVGRPAELLPVPKLIEQQSFATEQKTDNQPSSAYLTPVDKQLEKELNSNKENLSEVQPNITAVENVRNVISVKENPGIHPEESSVCVENSNCGLKSPRVVSSRHHPTQPLRDLYQHKVCEAEEPPSFFGRTHSIKNVKRFQRYFQPASVRPLFHQDENSCGFQLHKDIVSSPESTNFTTAHEWFQYECLKYHSQSHPKPKFQPLGLHTGSKAGDDLDRNEQCWRGRGPGSQAPNNNSNLYRCCSSSSVKRVAHHTSTTMTTLVSRSSVSAAPHRGLRPRCRRWSHSSRTAAEVCLPQYSHPSNVCCRDQLEISCQDQQERLISSSSWFNTELPFGRSALDSDVSRSIPVTSSLSPGHNVVLTSSDQLGGSSASSSEELVDLSVEETVEYFLKMTSPLGEEMEEQRTNASAGAVTLSLESLHWNFP